jgi:hypothetical protein
MQSPTLHKLRRLRQGDDFSVGGRVTKLFSLIIRLGDYPVLIDNNRANGNIAIVLGYPRSLNSCPHKPLIFFAVTHSSNGSGENGK